MGKKTFYLSDQEEEIYQKAKLYAGESISSIINDCLAKFVVAKEAAMGGFVEVPLFIGSSDPYVNTARGETIKFFGRHIGREELDVGLNKKERISLYYTKKGKFLAYIQQEDHGLLESSYKIFEDHKALSLSGMASHELLRKAEEMLDEKPVTVLDI